MFVIYSGTFNKYSNFIPQKTMSGYHFEMRTEQFDGEKTQSSLFLKCGNHYGKAAIDSPFDTNRRGKLELGHVRAKIKLLLNRVPGDRNLTSCF